MTKTRTGLPMRNENHHDVRVSFPDRYRHTESGPPHVLSRRPAEKALPDPGTVDAAVTDLLGSVQFEVAHEMTLEMAPGERLTRSSDVTERAIKVELDTAAGESAVILANRDGVYSWIFPSGLGAVNRTAGRSIIDHPSTLVFEIPLLDGVIRGRGGLLDAGSAAIGWVKVKVLKFAAGVAVGVGMRLLERGVDPGLVLVSGDRPEDWTRLNDFRQLILPENRRPRVLLLIHGTFSSTLGSFRVLASSPWGRQLLADLNARYDAVVGFDHFTLSDTPDVNAVDLLRRIEARPWDKGLLLDGIAYSRGALVLRSLVESGLPNSALLHPPEARFETGVLVGGTNAGTALAEPENWHSLLDLYTNLAVGAARVTALLAGSPVVPILVTEALKGITDFAKYLATEAVDRNGIPGLAAMDPNGDFVRRINQKQPSQPDAGQVSYHAVVSNFEPGNRSGGILDELPKRLMLAVADTIVDQLMGERNDLVVNTASMTAVDDPADGFVREVLDFGQNAHVYHLVYFTQRRLDAVLRRWLDIGDARGVAAAGADAVPQFEAALRPADTVPGLPVAPRSTAAGPTSLVLDVEVLWDDIAHAPGDVAAVGHYRGVLPQKAELALDWAISGPGTSEDETDHLVLTIMTRRNLIRGQVGDVSFFPRQGRDRHRLVAVCGMGFQGSFSSGDLRSLHRTLAWSVMALPSHLDISTVLIGAGEGNLTTRDALRGLLEGFADALRSSDRKIGLLRIVEFDRKKAGEVYRLLTEAEAWPVQVQLRGKGPRNGTAGKIDDALCLEALLEGIKRAGAGADLDAVSDAIPKIPSRRRIVDRLGKLAQENGTVPDLIGRLVQSETSVPASESGRPGKRDRIAFYLGDGQVRASAIADEGSTVPERILRLDPKLLEDAARRMSNPPTASVAELGTLLQGLVVPHDFRNYLAGSDARPLVIEVDRGTAPIHWEMLARDSREEGSPEDPRPEPIALQRPVARQLRTVYSPPPFWRSGREGMAVRALVIGDPGDPAKYHDLPGARAEAKVVARLLTEAPQFAKVHALIGAPAADGGPTEPGFSPATRIDVLRILMNESIDLIHYAGHGSYDPKDPTQCGWLFKDGMLTAGEISRVDRVPPLVIANACLTSRLAREDAEDRYDAVLLPSLADEFLQRGVVNYVGTAWEIDDRGAVQFAKAFYGRLLDGAPIGQALLEARRELAKRSDALWAAYQHYGDPSFDLTDL